MSDQVPQQFAAEPAPRWSERIRNPPDSLGDLIDHTCCRLIGPLLTQLLLEGRHSNGLSSTFYREPPGRKRSEEPPNNGRAADELSVVQRKVHDHFCQDTWLEIFTF